MTGIYREIARPERLVNTQRFDTPWLPGEFVLTTMLRSGMESGASASYDRLAEVLAENTLITP